MGKALGHYRATGSTLQGIVANAGGRVHGLFHIALLQNLAGVLRMVRLRRA